MKYWKLLKETVQPYWKKALALTRLGAFQSPSEGTVPVKVVRPARSGRTTDVTPLGESFAGLQESWDFFRGLVPRSEARLVRERRDANGYERLYRWPGGMAYTAMHTWTQPVQRSTRRVSGGWIGNR